MRIINLAENTEGAAGCGFEHGLCFYIETEHHKLLMDTGQSDLFIKNAEKLGVDLTKVDTVVNPAICRNQSGRKDLCAGICIWRILLHRQ